MTHVARCCLAAIMVLAAHSPSRGVAREPTERIRKPDDFSVRVQPREIAPGETALLRWSIKGATKVLIEEASESSRKLRELGTFGGSGTLQVRPKEDTTYVFSCQGLTTYSCASVSIRVRVKRR